ncbi:MAG: DUF1800 domain-containing protein [Rhodospirillales bacterium]
MNSNAAVAFSRFGLGRRRDEKVPADPRAWLLAQLEGPDPARFPDLPGTPEALAMVDAEQRSAKEAVAAAQQFGTKRQPTMEQQALGQLHQRERAALLANSLTTEAGFRERLVLFWFNHFTVAARPRPAMACVGAYIREAIRPNVTGRFRDMLLAVMRHPAMLAYLDQFHSVGPGSYAGVRHLHGLNENLARECLELHTVTPASGYTQADVTNFAKILTGWSMEYKTEPRGFVYRPNTHEPGEQTVMGQVWPDGEEGGVAILEWLADHPSTQRHLAEKLVRHFVADDPPPADVAHIEAVLRNTRGDLGAAARALVDLPSAWQPLTKLRTPQEYVIASMRAVGAHPDAEPQLPAILQGLGQPMFRPAFPIGWPDRAADWAGPEAMLQRVDFSYQFAGRVTDQEPVDIAENTLGPLLGAETLNQIRHAGSRQDALALLLSSPEFQRR